MRLRGERVVVIGGSSGIGLATAKAAVREGTSVVIASRSSAKLDAAREEIEDLERPAGGAGAQDDVHVETRVLDARDEEAVERFFRSLASFDHLATPGSETVLGSLGELGSADARRAFDVKYWPQYLAAKHGATRMRDGGSITFMAGSFSQRPQPLGTVQASINAAIEGLGRALAVELGPIRVNTVSPGMVDTPMWSHLSPEEREGMYAATAEGLPAGRIASSDEVGEAIVFLMANPHMTGTTLFIDGGETLR